MRSLAVVLLALSLGACDTVLGWLDAPTPDISAVAPPYARLRPEVIAVYPHDARVFTQGLLRDSDGTLYESGGLYGQSLLRQVDLVTGESLREVALAPQYFAEGLALVDDRLIQLTWREGVALVYDKDTFEQIDTFTYDTEGWGLCYDGESLYMTDGTSTLYRRDPFTFDLLDTRTVRLDGVPLIYLNELECVDEWVYANVWLTDDIVQIDKRTGQVVALIDASGLIPPEERASPQWRGDVLNGIAYDPDRDLFYLTGKLWDRLFAVRFVPMP